jgi:RNA polymerase sigma-70 factor (ECF subfamily)
MEDKAAIEQVLNGDKEAFRFLVERYQNQAVAHAAAILGCRSEAQDAAQEAFIDAYNSLRRFDKERQFYPWLYVLVRNRCFKMLARRKPADDIEEIEIIAPRSGVSPEEHIGLERALRDLAAEDREIITLKHLEGLSYKEIAAYLEIPVGTVMSRLFYARRQLQAGMSGKFSGEKKA